MPWAGVEHFCIPPVPPRDLWGSAWHDAAHPPPPARVQMPTALHLTAACKKHLHPLSRPPQVYPCTTPWGSLGQHRLTCVGMEAAGEQDGCREAAR